MLTMTVGDVPRGVQPRALRPEACTSSISRKSARETLGIRRRFVPLFVTNLFGTRNDNFLKTLASFIVISPLADRLTVVFPKRRILQFANNVCCALPKGARVIGVRTRGLWGSVWSRRGRMTSPKFVPTFEKSVLLWFFVAPFVLRRKVAMHVEDLTERIRQWSQLTRLEFNRHLELWYNSEK